MRPLLFYSASWVDGGCVQASDHRRSNSLEIISLALRLNAPVQWAHCVYH